MKRITAMFLALVMCLAFAGAADAAPAQVTAVNSYQAEVYFTEGAGLALRTSPDTEAEKILEIPENTVLLIDQVSSGWGHVTYDGYEGWVSLQYTKITGSYPTPAPAGGYIDPVYYTVHDTEGEGLELRTQATEKSSTFGPLADGTVFKAQAQDEDWVYGEYNGNYGWCNTSYLRASTADEISQYEARTANQTAQGQAAQGSADQGQTVQSQTVTPAQTGADMTSNPGRLLRLPTDNGYVQAYMNHLNENWYAINAYNWQMSYTSEGEESVTRAVVLSNIYGDEIPELIYLAAAPDESGEVYDAPVLYIMTYEDGMVRTLYADTWDISPYDSGYYDYYFFRMEDKDTLYYFRDIGGDGGRIEYGRFDATVDGTLKIRELFADQYTNTDYGVEHEYLKQGNAISEESYAAQIAHAQSSTKSILMYSDGCGDFVEDYVAQNGCPAMTVDEALTLLSEFPGTAQSTAGEAGGVTITF